RPLSATWTKPANGPTTSSCDPGIAGITEIGTGNGKIHVPLSPGGQPRFRSRSFGRPEGLGTGPDGGFDAAGRLRGEGADWTRLRGEGADGARLRACGCGTEARLCDLTGGREWLAGGRACERW